MSTRPFLDSNILLYAYGVDAKTNKAQEVCDQPYVIGVQSLNEFASVSRRKLGYDWDHIRQCLISIMQLAEEIVPLTFEIHDRGLALAERHKLQVYDGMILAAALEAGCDTLLTEDMHNGLIVESKLTVRNPFV